MKKTRKPTILIADGQTLSRKILRMLLRTEYDVVEAADGAEAVRLMKAAPGGIDGLLLDVRLSAGHGLRVLDLLRREGLTDRIPVIALTSAAEANGHRRCYEAGAADVIEKPYREDLLLYKLKWNLAHFHQHKENSAPPPSEASVVRRRRVALCETGCGECVGSVEK